MSAFVFVSGDAIKGTNRKGENLWDAILKMYEQACMENPGKLSERSSYSIKTRYKRLNTNISKWVGVYKEAYNNKTSGISMADVEEATSKIYDKNKGFLHTLVFNEVMRHAPKWELNLGGDHIRPHSDEPDSDGEGYGSSKRSITDEDDGATKDVPETPVSGSSSINRPTGREAAKAKRKAEGKAVAPPPQPIIPDEFTTELRAMWITRELELEAMNKFGNERIELEKKKLRANLLAMLLGKANLSSREEDLKNRLLGEYLS